MNELERWASRPASLIPTREERVRGQEMEGAVHAARVAALRTDALAAVTGRMLERAASLDAQRITLAGDNPDLNAVLIRIELGFAVQAEALQQQAVGRGFRL